MKINLMMYCVLLVKEILLRCIVYSIKTTDIEKSHFSNYFKYVDYCISEPSSIHRK